MHDESEGRAAMTRLARAWGAMRSEQRLAGLAALALLVTMLLPWYALQSLDRRTGVIYSHTINAFGDVSFVEAAIFLVAAGVLAMLLARAEQREFHMPGGDGTIVTLAGGWAALLIFYRVFDRPAGNGYPVGIEWGFFQAFVAAGALAYAGWRMRGLERPGPPLLRAREQRRRPPGERPRAGDASPTQPPASAPARAAATAGARERPRYPPAPGSRVPAPAKRLRAVPEQLSFEDPPARGR
jgi:hypothetical protein